MLLTDTILVRADPDLIYRLGADIEAWPALLPHYRYVRVESRDDDGVMASMGASRSGIPVSWRARQVTIPAERRIQYRHIGGITRDMDVEWRIEPEGGAVRVTITHDLDYPVPVLGPLFARYIVGGLFIHHIAGKTLRCIQRKAEETARTPAGSS